MPDDVRPQLTGIEIHDLEPELCLLITPNGGQFPITAPVREFRAWLGRCDGSRTRAELLAGRNPDYAEVLDVLEADGCLRAGRDEEAGRLAATTVLLAGAPELTGPLADLLAPTGYARIEPLTGLDHSFPAAAPAHAMYRRWGRQPIGSLAPGRSELLVLPLHRDRIVAASSLPQP
ncbi:hypothetical protein [Amycolatopsis sp. lyj-109]|uniref:hypothetical protein n=1 Tax=Amycolatopsis sp. lyj-109 TaxID=2789287 RepID=UPI00397B1782